MQTIRSAVQTAGGVKAVSKAAQVTERAVYKWISRDSLPYTDYKGETTYAQKISELTNGKLSKDEILKIGLKPVEIISP